MTRPSLNSRLIPACLLWLAALFVLGFFVLKNQLADAILVLGTGLLLAAAGMVALHHIFCGARLKQITKNIELLLAGQPYKELPIVPRDEIGTISQFFNEISHSLKDLTQNYQTQSRMQKEISAAQIIQQELLPKTQPTLEGLEIYAKTQSASEIGGDAFDFYHSKGHQYLFLGDSTGHGLPAGLVMIMVDTLLETFLDLCDNAKEILAQLNKYLKPHLKPTMFMTMIFAEWKPASSEFAWVGCGHEHVIHVQSAQNTVQVIPTGGIALGMLPDNSALLKEQSFVLNDQDLVVLYSDGITEAKNEQGEVYGLPRLSEFMKTKVNSTMSCESIFKKLIDDVNRFMGSHAQDDDMSLIILKKLGKK